MLALRVLEADGGEQSPWLHCWLEYGSRPAISLEKIRYELFKGGVFSQPTYSGYRKENVHPFEPLDLPAELTQHVSYTKYRKFESLLPCYSATRAAAPKEALSPQRRVRLRIIGTWQLLINFKAQISLFSP